MTTYHALAVHDLSADLSDVTTLLFRTEAGARGYAARKGSLYGMRQFRLDGFRLALDPADAEFAEEPCGYENRGRRFLYVPEVA